MSSWNIFCDRLERGWKYQYGVIRSIADWTIMLYLIFPANIIFFFVYRSWWLKTPEWIHNIPLLFLFFFFYVISWSGDIRTFVQEGDKVFLIKRASIFIGIKKWGFLYSAVFQAFQMAITFLIFLPFLRNYYLLDWKQIIILFIYFISIKLAILLLKYYLRKIEARLKKIAASILIFISLWWGSQYIFLLWEKGWFAASYVSSVLIITVSIFLSLRMLKKVSFIDHDITIDIEDKLKNINLIFSVTYEIEKSTISKRTKPLLFRRSKRIFKKRTNVTGFLELFIKIFIRNFAYAGGYVQIISVTTAALVIIPPLWIKVIIFIGFLIMMYSWLSIVWNRITTSNPISKKYSGSNFYFTARKRAVTALFILAILILCIFSICWLLVFKQLGFQPGMFIN